jgi:hypothetical protein
MDYYEKPRVDFFAFVDTSFVPGSLREIGEKGVPCASGSVWERLAAGEVLNNTPLLHPRI